MSAGVACRRYVAAELGRYWPRGLDAVLRLAVPASPANLPATLPPRLESVHLPAWAADLGVASALLVPRQCIVPGESEAWQRTDWWGAAAWFLTGAAERAHERAHGPIHSYAFRLAGWDGRIWDRAWVNRMALFLRRRAARELQRDEIELFGSLPAPEILLTHDVDAIRKTPAARFKRSAFHGYNALRLALRGRAADALGKVGAAARALFSAADYRCMDEMRKAEDGLGIRSWFFVYGGDPRRRSLRRALFDPAYDAQEDGLAAELRALSANGWQIGLHQSFDAWRDAALMSGERSRLEGALRGRVTLCRQHWLRFSWEETWRAQEAAGLELDATLGFNDRPGFRNGAALRFHPWDTERGAPLRLEATPMILMDSQLYDYGLDSDPESEIRRWIGEVKAVGGTASVLWHPHTLSPDYGWLPGFRALLDAVGKSAP